MFPRWSNHNRSTLTGHEDDQDLATSSQVSPIHIDFLLLCRLHLVIMDMWHPNLKSTLKEQRNILYYIIFHIYREDVGTTHTTLVLDHSRDQTKDEEKLI